MPAGSRESLMEDPRLDEMARSLPQTIFKYMRVDDETLLQRARQLVTESSLYFPSPRSFNDPFDCRVVPSFEASASLIEAYGDRVGRESFPLLTESERKERVDSLVRRATSSDGQAEMARTILDVVGANGVSCFSTTATNNLMWSYYAAGHSGIAVRFNTDAVVRLRQAEGLIFPLRVSYSSSFPDLNFFTSDIWDFHIGILGTKAASWAHEQEWRLVRLQRTGPLQIPPEMIDGVILGLSTRPDVETEVRRWIAGRVPPIELMRVVKGHRTFDLILEADFHGAAVAP